MASAMDSYRTPPNFIDRHYVLICTSEVTTQCFKCIEQYPAKLPRKT